MNILVTGAKGFFGKNLVVSLNNIKDGKDRTRQGLKIEEVICIDKDTTDDELAQACKKADFVFNLAGINRPKDANEFMEGNRDFASSLLNNLAKYENHAPVMLASSIQASLFGRYEGSEYGKSKLEAEALVFHYSETTGVPVYVYRFTNLFGKWCRPNYNSVIATFCYNIANDLPIQINDENTELELLYIDDAVNAMIDILEGKIIKCNYDGIKPIFTDDGIYCYAKESHIVTLGRVAELLKAFNEQPKTLVMPTILDGSFEKKLYSTFLSYLPREKIVSSLSGNTDTRGTFTEVLKTPGYGQFSVSVSEPGATKGQHWHHSKWEIFIVVSGHGLIQERNIWTDEILEFEVSGERLMAVRMLPGYSHNIINCSDTEKLVTLMWANDIFDPNHPDTYREIV